VTSRTTQLKDRNSGVSLETRDSRLGLALVSPTFILFSILILYPLFQGIWLSLTRTHTMRRKSKFVGFDNYVEMFQMPEFWTSLLNTFIWTAGTMTLQIVIGVAVAMMLHQTFIFRSLARALILFPYLLSVVVAVLVWQWLFNDIYGLLNHFLLSTGIIEQQIDWLGVMPNAMISIILVGAWKYFPFVVIAVLARLQTIPEELYEASKIDGANTWERFWDITLPQLRGVLFIVVLLRAIWDFKEFDLIFLMTGGGPVIGTQTLPLMVYKESFRLFHMGMASAIAVAMFIIMLVFMLFYFRVYGRDERGS